MLQDDRVLVGYDHADDAAVYELDDGSLLVQTVDFFTPVVDDAYDYGRVAAANSLSDIYAMGAKPIFALAVVAFPIKKYPADILADILRGGYEKAHEAGAPVVGGHSIDDNEPKFGLVVSGLTRRRNLMTNSGSRPGDLLLLTKPLGSGLYTTAIKQGKASEQMVRAVVAVMSKLNRDASEAAVSCGIRGCTDVTGYGLLGHLHELMEASGTSALLTAEQVPTMPGLDDLIQKGALPGGTIANLEYSSEFVDWHKDIDDTTKLILADAQTSGGLLISCPPAQLAALQGELARRGVTAPIIGAVFDGPEGSIAVVP